MLLTITVCDPDALDKFLVVNFHVGAAEFLGVMSRDIKGYDSEADIRNAWKVFDKDNKGVISTAELRHVLSSIGEKLSPAEMEEMIKESDPDNDGMIQYEEFVKMLMAK